MTSNLLFDLASKHGTDKLEHQYIKVYSEELELKNPISLLEIGIAKGASALMWNEYFGSDADLYFLDLFKDADHVSPRWCRSLGFIPIEGSQADINVLAGIKKEFDYIIDDGSHLSAHMIISWKHLFVNNLQSGGKYFIEDVHTCTGEFWWGEGVEKFEDTPLWMFKNFIETGEISNKFFNEGEMEVYKSLIEDVKIFDDKLIMIKRK